VEDVGREAYGRFLFQNALDPTAFPSALVLENALVGIVAEHLGGGEQAVGTFTSGGTESIMLACKAARDHARATRPEVTRPAMVLPTTAHAAFHKSAHYLGFDVILVDVDPVTFRADVEAIRAAITPETVLLVGSAPSYAHGVIDPIEDLGKLALERGLLLHVDACVGGWLLPYFRRLGEDVPPFDLSVPGVTSLSVDLHKYGFAPKGASLVLYGDPTLRQHQYFACTEWTGYAVINAAVQSSKSTGPIAAAWAVLHRLGDEGFLDLARQTLAGTRALVAGIQAIPGLRVLGNPDFCMVAAAADDVSAFHVVDEMQARGFYVQPQPDHVEPLLEALRASVEAARELPAGQLAAAVEGVLAGLSPAEAQAKLLELLPLAGIEGTSLPDRMAPVNEVLDALPPPLRAALLTGFVAELFTPRAPALSGA
jgi:glutamate/tyrosine decarboxylase-like PLP-dependent enzyme